MSRLPLFIIILMVFSCSSEPTQEERYQEVTSGLSYRTYKAAAGKTSGAIVKLYNAQKADTVAPLKEGYVHLLLGYSWTVSGKSAMAFAEADLAEESPETEVKMLAVALRSIAMYEMGLDSLGSKEAKSVNRYVPQSDSTVSYEPKIFYLILGLAKAYAGEWEESKFYWAGFANETGIHWPYQLIDAFADYKNGKIQNALQKFKAMSQDPAVPAGLRSELGTLIGKIEQEAGDVNSSLFWPRLLSKVLYKQLKESSSAHLNGILNVIDVPGEEK